ncbi:zinc-binding dehydrogenase [Aureibacter tunicatorum]|uniref:NADPH:quinone reductase-like Zn-dependent oxidoreductase n=1 Tax=Aureibacter tunicatorum TaxID=866807 RepID=A0AAE3XJ85_9BACT|nr:zinc-binding dehydrogenase [Aureibacter tunicatorum]MDR6237149.1 NADPH:quinone reductase-like Zn-dependent oxidoreductase [Aureibacter tunicatorum]BDD06141.1 alcohol dehydrogenase [Aureibacter tunicatorum]
MKAYTIPSTNRIEDLKIERMNTPIPGHKEVLVKVKAIGLNPVDYKIIEGSFGNLEAGHIPGVDGAGEVVSVGDGVESIRFGQKVMFHADLSKNGSFAEMISIPEHVLTVIDDRLTFEEAACIPCAGYTAYQAIVRKMNIKEGDKLLVQGGSGGVGSFAIQIAKSLGAFVITTCSGIHEHYVKELGADVMINYHDHDVLHDVMEMTDGVGVDAVLDTVSGGSATQALKMLAFNGQLAFIAGAPDYSKVKPFGKALSFHEVALGGTYLSGNFKAQQDLANMGKELLFMHANETLQLPKMRIYDFGGLPEALNHLKQRHYAGKLIVRVD